MKQKKRKKKNLLKELKEALSQWKHIPWSQKTLKGHRLEDTKTAVLSGEFLF